MNDNTNTADTFAQYLDKVSEVVPTIVETAGTYGTGDFHAHDGTSGHAGYRSDTIAPTESAAAYGRRTAIVEDEGPPSPLPHVFTGKAEHPYVTRKGLVARCRHCWGLKSQH